MKPLPSCPYCGSKLKQVKQNESWHEEYCYDHCRMEYHQYYHGDFTSQELSYISFSTSHFNVYVYFEHGFHPNVVHFYSKKELADRGLASTIVKNMPANRIPTQELEEFITQEIEDLTTKVGEWLDRLDEKLHTLAIFA